MASSVHFSSQSSVQPSVYWRIGDEPMNVQHSIGTPVRCTTSTIGAMSLTWVRAAQLARTRRPAPAISRASRFDVAHDMRTRAGQPDVGGVDAQRVDQVEDANLLVDARRPDRRRLQPVAQRLVVEHDDRRRRRRRRPCSSRRSDAAFMRSRLTARVDDQRRISAATTPPA